jgi:hypothetical protein
LIVSSNLYCHHKSIDSPINVKKFAMELIWLQHLLFFWL